MPDVIGDKGKIQWEAPSNRKSGKFKDTHQKRLEWWIKKATEINIDPNTGKNWISQTAKTIHPTKQKPCKNCGLVLDIRYCYPSKLLINRIQKLPYITAVFEISPIEHIATLVERLYKAFGNRVFKDLPSILKTGSLKVPKLPDSLEAWNKWLLEEYIPQEPITLSPGAMSNAPDRFDGFHSFNRCCRERADKGRSKENLQSYCTDRRVFEYWVDGDWIAADRLMGQVRSDKKLKKESCFNLGDGNLHPTPCQADHIGPISLGFSHRAQFQFLCKPCNSGKNNRMYESDVKLLIKAEADGEQVVSWFAEDTWNARKLYVNSRETALRLSKLLRDNRHCYMELLKRIYEAGYLGFLISLLSLEKADYEPEFINLRAENHLTKFDDIKLNPRSTKYVLEQKARRIRIAFESLITYHQKENRNSFVLITDEFEAKVQEAFNLLESVKSSTKSTDDSIIAILLESEISEEALRDFADKLPDFLKSHDTVFEEAKYIFKEAMALIAKQLSAMWEDDRYVRAAISDDD